MSNAEQQRILENATRKAHWNRWGPYLSNRQWGTVREDYSADGNAWDYFSHEQAPLRAYRWGKDGLGDFCDHHCQICFALAFWNGQDPILKERLFGLTNAFYGVGWYNLLAASVVTFFTVAAGFVELSLTT